MDNTDIFIITKKKYMNMVEEHLRQSARDIDKEKVIYIQVFKITSGYNMI